MAYYFARGFQYDPSQYGIDVPDQGESDYSILDNPWINNAATRSALTGIDFISSTLSKPRNAIFGALGGLIEGKPLEAISSLANLIPFSDTLGLTNSQHGEGLWGRMGFDPLTSSPVDGRELLRKAGLADREDTWGNFAAGLALDIAGDPLAWVKGPLGALSKAGESAQKAGTLERSLAGRIAKGQGGWLGIADRPWYAELIPGVGRQQNVAVLGTGAYGQAAADAMKSGWSRATRATIPGTDFAPLAWARSSFEKGAGNLSGHGPVVDAFGDVVAPAEQKALDLAGELSMPIGYKQAEALNKLTELGMTPTQASIALRRGSSSAMELGDIYLPPNITPAQEQVVREFSDFYTKNAGNILNKQRAELARYGRPIDDSSQVWGHGYNPRNQADTGNRLTTQQTMRDKMFTEFPGGEAQIEDILTNPAFSGFANSKAKGKPFTALDQLAIENHIEQVSKPAIKQSILDEGKKQAARLQAQGIDLSERAAEILTDDGADALAGEIARYAAYLDPKIAERGYFYRQDPFLGVMNYGRNLAPQQAVLKGTIEAIAREAKPLETLSKPVTNMREIMTIPKALEELSMTGQAADQLMMRFPGLQDVKELGNLAVPKKLVDALKTELAGPKPASRAAEAMSSLTSNFRYGVTVPWPANFVRNWAGELVNEAVSGTSPVRNLGTAASRMRNTLTDPALLKKAQAAYDAGIATGVMGQSQIHELLGTGITGTGDLAFNLAPTQKANGIVESLKEWAQPITKENVRKGMRITPLDEIFEGSPRVQKAAQYAKKVVDPVRGYMGAMEQAHAFQNEATRLQQIMSLMDEGYSPKAAAHRVSKIQRDYSNLTPFESGVMRNVVPFYNFSKQNIISQADSILRQPGRFNAMTQVVNSGRSEDSFVPNWASSGTAIPIPGAPEGSQRFIGTLGLPAEDEAIGALAALVNGSPFEAIRRAASSSNPLIKVPYEMATGRQIFSGRDLEDLKSSPALSALFGDNNFSRGVSEAITGTPLSRVMSTIDRAANTEPDNALALLLNLGTGIRTVDVNQEQAANIAARNVLQRLMRESGKFKTRTDVYLKPELKGQEQDLPPEVLKMLAQYQFLTRQSAAAAKAKAAAEQP